MNFLVENMSGVPQSVSIPTAPQTEIYTGNMHSITLRSNNKDTYFNSRSRGVTTYSQQRLCGTVWLYDVACSLPRFEIWGLAVAVA